MKMWSYVTFKDLWGHTLLFEKISSLKYYHLSKSVHNKCCRKNLAKIPKDRIYVKNIYLE